MAETNSEPVYNPVSTSDNPEDSQNDKPPSYFNVLKQIRAAKEESTSPVDLTTKTFNIICGSFIATLVLVISSVMPIAMLIIGIIYKEDCAIQTKIPLWLIVTGATGIALAVFKCIGGIFSGVNYRKNGESKEPALLSCANCLLTIFSFVWFIIGNVWVYSIYNIVKYDQVLFPESYCNKVCYLFSFWSITITWIFLALVCCCVCGCIVLAIGCAGCAGCAGCVLATKLCDEGES